MKHKVKTDKKKEAAAGPGDEPSPAVATLVIKIEDDSDVEDVYTANYRNSSTVPSDMEFISEDKDNLSGSRPLILNAEEKKLSLILGQFFCCSCCLVFFCIFIPLVAIITLLSVMMWMHHGQK